MLKSGRWGRLDGEAVARFEQRFAAYHDARHAIAVANGTVALRIALLASGVQAGDEVIVPPYTFLSTASSVIECNATPVFVDIDSQNLNLDPGRIEAAITSRTRATIPVHLVETAAARERALRSLPIVTRNCHCHDDEDKKAGSRVKH